MSAPPSTKQLTERLLGCAAGATFTRDEILSAYDGPIDEGLAALVFEAPSYEALDGLMRLVVVADHRCTAFHEGEMNVLHAAYGARGADLQTRASSLLPRPKNFDERIARIRASWAPPPKPGDERPVCGSPPETTP